MSITRLAVLLALSLPVVVGAAERGSILLEHWRDLGGSRISDLTGQAAYPGQPHASALMSSFEAPTNWANDYGTRMRGWLHVDVTGAYRFWIAGDDQCELWLGTSADPASKVRIARVPEWTSPRQWEKFPEQASAEIVLQAGERYFIEALHKEGGGLDNLAVAWTGPGLSRSVIPGAQLSPVPLALIAGGGAFTGSATVSMTASVPGAAIRYTRDGSDPDAGSPLYTGPFTIDRSTVVRAMVVLADGALSEVATRAFLLTGDGTGLTGLYYPNQHLLGIPTQRHDPRIAFDWNSGAPLAGLPADGFSVRWLGSLEPRFDEPYTLIARTDDGVRVWLDGRLIIDSWIHRSATDSAHTFLAEAGRRYALRVETFEGSGVASARLAWSSASEPRQIIPTSQLHPANGTDLTIPTESFVSPAFVEGTFVPGMPPAAIVAGDPLELTFLSDLGFWMEVPLRAEMAVPVEVATGLATVTGAITWTPTPLMGQGRSVIRAGDALLFAGVEAGSWSILAESGMELAESPIPAGALVPHRFTRPGHYHVVAKNTAGETIAERVVTAIAVELPARLAAEVGHARPVTVPILPEGTGEHIVITGNDGGLLLVAPRATNPADLLITAKPQRRGMPALVARLGGDRGPILATRVIDEFTRETDAGSKGIVNADTQRAMRQLVMRPYIPDLWWNFDMFAHHATFRGGADSFRINTSGGAATNGEDPFIQEFDPATGEMIGRFRFAIELPPGKHNACLRIWPSQINSPEQIVGQSSSYNPCYCKVKVGQIEMCEGQVRELPVEVTEACPEVGKQQIGTTSGSTGDSPPPVSGTTQVDCAKLGPVTGVMIGSSTHQVGEGIPTGKYTVWIGSAYFEDVVLIRNTEPSGDVRYDPVRVRACPLDAKELNAQLGNTGPCTETFKWVVTSDGDPDVTLANTEGSVTLAPGDSTTITTTATVNVGSPVGEETVTIKVTVRGQQVASASAFVEHIYTCEQEPTLEFTDTTQSVTDLCEEGAANFSVTVQLNEGLKACDGGEQLGVPIEIDQYAWSSPNAVVVGNGATATATFPAPGVYTVTVKVTGKLADANEYACSDPEPIEHTFTVTVHDWACSMPPRLMQGMPEQSHEVVCSGQPVTFAWPVLPIDGERTCGDQPGAPALPVPIRATTRITVVGGEYGELNGEYRFYEIGEYRITYRVTAAFIDPMDALYCDLPADAVHTFTVTVAQPGIAIDGNSDNEGPGAYVGVNWDDDDNNDVDDADDNGPVSGEDDLVAVTIDNPFAGEGGQIVVSGWLGWDFGWWNYGFARLWADAGKSVPVILPATWAAGEAPTTLYLEGIEPSWPGAVRLQVTYVHEEGESCSDEAFATIFGVFLFANDGLYPGLYEALGTIPDGTYHWSMRDHDTQGEWIRNASTEAAQTGFRLNPPHEAIAPGTPDVLHVAYECNGGRAVSRQRLQRVTMTFDGEHDVAAMIHAGPLTGRVQGNQDDIQRAELGLRHQGNRFGIRLAEGAGPVIAVAAAAEGQPQLKAAAAAGGKRFDADVFFQAPANRPGRAEFAYLTTGGILATSHLQVEHNANNRSRVDFSAEGAASSTGSFKNGPSTASYAAEGSRYVAATIDLHDQRPGYNNRLQASFADDASSGSVLLRDRQGRSQFIASSGAGGRLTTGAATFVAGASNARLTLGDQRDVAVQLRGNGNERSIGDLIIGPDGTLQGELKLTDGNRDIGSITVVNGDVTAGNFSFANNHFSGAMSFGAEEIRSADLAIFSPRGQASVHYEKAKNRFHGVLNDIGNGILADLVADDDGLVTGRLGFTVTPENYLDITVGDDRVRKAKARFKPNENFDVGCDITETTKAGHFLLVNDDQRNVIDVRMDAEGDVLGRIGLDDGVEQGFRVERYDDGRIEGFIRDKDEGVSPAVRRQIIIKTQAGGRSPKVTSLVPDIAVGQTAVFRYATTEYTITKKGDADYELGASTATIVQGVALGVAGGTGYIAWALIENGQIEVKRSQSISAIDGKAEADCIFYNDGSFRGTITANGTWRGHQIKIDVADADRAALTTFSVDYRRGTQITGKLAVDTNGGAEGSFTAKVDGLDIAAAYGKAAGVTGTVAWTANGSGSGTLTFAEKGKRASFEATATPIPELTAVFGFDSTGVYRASLDYGKNGKVVGIRITDDGSWSGDLSFATPLGKVAVQLRQDGGKATATATLDRGDGNRISLNVSEDKTVSGTLNLASGNDSLSLTLGFNAQSRKVIANGFAQFKNFGGSGLDSRFGLEDDGDKASYSADIVDPTLPTRRFAGLKLDKSGELEELRLGVGTEQRYFEAKGRSLEEFGFNTRFDLALLGLPDSSGEVRGSWNHADGEDKVGVEHSAMVEGRSLVTTLAWELGGEADVTLNYADKYTANVKVGPGGTRSGKVGIKETIDALLVDVTAEYVGSGDKLTLDALVKESSGDSNVEVKSRLVLVGGRVSEATLSASGKMVADDGSQLRLTGAAGFNLLDKEDESSRSNPNYRLDLDYSLSARLNRTLSLSLQGGAGIKESDSTYEGLGVQAEAALWQSGRLSATARYRYLRPDDPTDQVREEHSAALVLTYIP